MASVLPDQSKINYTKYRKVIAFTLCYLTNMLVVKYLYLS